MIRFVAVIFVLAVATSAQAMSPAPLHQPDGMMASPPRMRRGYALCQWSLRDDCRPPQRPQVRGVGCRARSP